MTIHAPLVLPAAGSGRVTLQCSLDTAEEALQVSFVAAAGNARSRQAHTTGSYSLVVAQVSWPGTAVAWLQRLADSCADQ